MKLSCLSVSLFPLIAEGKMTILEYARLCKSFGLDGFDLGMILIKNHTPRYLQQLRNDIKESGIGLTMITTYPDFTHPDKKQREREFEYLRSDIALASNLGARFLRITAGQAHPTTGREEGIRWVVESFRNIAPVADHFGIKLVYEDHSKPGAWDYMDFSNPPDIFLEIYRQIQDTSIGINFDTANILVANEDNTIEVLEQVYNKVETIHVNDISVKGKMSPIQIGSGIVPIKEIFSFLKEREFNGWLCIEEWGNNGIEGVKNAIEYVKEAWKNPV